jgi:hypothetical protein
MRRTTRIATTVATVVALSAPSAALAQQDLRSPDAKDISSTRTVARSVDLRSPDAQDAALPRTIVVRPAPATPPLHAGLEWADAGIGAAGMLGLILAGTGGAVLVRRHRGAAPISR